MRNAETRTVNCSALRSLHAAEKQIRVHISRLMDIECDDPAAAYGIQAAVMKADEALQTIKAAKALAMGR